MRLFNNGFSFKQTDVFVRDAMNPTPVVIGSEEPALRAIDIIITKKIGGLLVVDNGILKGVLTKTDLLEKVSLDNKDPMALKVKDIMTNRFVSVGPNMKLNEAVKVMIKHDIRRLPVLSKGTLHGLLTQSDILTLQPNLIEMLVEKFTQSSGDVDVRSLQSIKGSCDMCGTFSSLKNNNQEYHCEDCL